MTNIFWQRINRSVWFTGCIRKELNSFVHRCYRTRGTCSLIQVFTFIFSIGLRGVLASALLRVGLGLFKFLGVHLEIWFSRIWNKVSQDLRSHVTMKHKPKKSLTERISYIYCLPKIVIIKKHWICLFAAHLSAQVK